MLPFLNFNSNRLTSDVGAPSQPPQPGGLNPLPPNLENIPDDLKDEIVTALAQNTFTDESVCQMVLNLCQSHKIRVCNEQNFWDALNNRLGYYGPMYVTFDQFQGAINNPNAPMQVRFMEDLYDLTTVPGMTQFSDVTTPSRFFAYNCRKQSDINNLIQDGWYGWEDLPQVLKDFVDRTEEHFGLSLLYNGVFIPKYKELLKELLEKGMTSLNNFSDGLQRSPEIVKLALEFQLSFRDNDQLIENMKPEMLNNRDVIMHILNVYFEDMLVVWDRLPDMFKDDREIAFRFMKRIGEQKMDRYIYSDLSPALRSDPEFIKVALEMNPSDIDNVPITITRDMFIFALQNDASGVMATDTADRFRADYQVAEVAISKYATTITDFSEEIQNNRGFALLAALNSSRFQSILNLLKPQFRQDYEIVKAAIEKNRDNEQYAPQELLDEIWAAGAMDVGMRFSL